MELSKIPTLVVGLIVAILIVTVVAIPIIDDASKSIITEMNNPQGIYSMAISSDAQITTIEPGVNGSIMINGVEQDQPVLSGMEKIWCDNFAFRVNVAEGGGATSITPIGITVSGTIKSIKYENGTVTVTNNSDVVTSASSSFFLYPDINGDYGGYDTRSAPLDDIHIGNDAKAWIGSGGTNFILFEITGKTSTIIGTPIMPDREDPELSVQFIDSKSGLTYQVGDNPVILYTNPSTSTVIQTDWTILYCPLKYLEVSETDGAIRSIINIMPVLLVVSMLVAVTATAFTRYQ